MRLVDHVKLAEVHKWELYKITSVFWAYLTACTLGYVCLVPDMVQNLAVSETEAWSITLEWQPPEPSDSVELYVVNVYDQEMTCINTTLVKLSGSEWNDDDVGFCAISF